MQPELLLERSYLSRVQHHRTFVRILVEDRKYTLLHQKFDDRKRDPAQPAFVAHRCVPSV